MRVPSSVGPGARAQVDSTDASRGLSTDVAPLPLGHARPVRSRRSRALTRCAALVALSTATISGASAIGGPPTQPPVERIDVITTGDESESHGWDASVSADGRFVVYSSGASRFVPADTNDVPDIFVRDRALSTTTRVSVATGGSEGDEASTESSISSDGRYVAFTSWASNLVRNDTNRSADVFVHDLLRHETTRVSVRSDGRQASRGGSLPAISADGRFVAFSSLSINLVPGHMRVADGIDRIPGLYLHDRRTGRTTAVSWRRSRTGYPVDYVSPSISADGRFVAFVRLDVRRQLILVRDRKARRTTRVDVNSRERNADGDSGSAAISANGRYVAFVSEATNLVPHDDNRGVDVFVRDLHRGRTVQASIRPDGAPVPTCPRERNEVGRLVLLSCGAEPAVSARGRFVAFSTRSPQFDTTSASADGSGIFLRDMRLKMTVPVMTGRSDDPDVHGRWTEPAISADGRFVAFRGRGIYVRGPLR